MIKKLYILLSATVWPLLACGQETNFIPKTASSYLNLTPPVSVKDAGPCADGGSVIVTLVDAQTNMLQICENHSLTRTNTLGRIYVSWGRGLVRYGRLCWASKDERLTPIKEGEQIKKAVICLALAWLEREFPSGDIRVAPWTNGVPPRDYGLKASTARFISERYRKK